MKHNREFNEKLIDSRIRLEEELLTFVMNRYGSTPDGKQVSRNYAVNKALNDLRNIKS